MRGAAGVVERRYDIQKDLDKVKKWVSVSFMKHNKSTTRPSARSWT